MNNGRIIFVILLFVAVCVVAYFLLKPTSKTYLTNLDTDNVRMVDTGGLKLSDLGGFVTNIFGSKTATTTDQPRDN